MKPILFSLFFTLSPLVEGAEPEGKILATVTIFVATDCPIANSYAPEINRLFEDYAGKGIAFQLVYPDPTVTEEEVGKHIADYAIRMPATIDRDHSLVKSAGVTITPEVAVFDAGKQIVYRGRIDNLYAGFGERRPQVTEHYLRDALDAVIKGEAPVVSKTDAIGCLIEVLP